jgi:hypothetical protein
MWSFMLEKKTNLERLEENNGEQKVQGTTEPRSGEIKALGTGRAIVEPESLDVQLSCRQHKSN